MDITVGVMALQGDFREHISVLKSCGIKTLEIRFPHQLEHADGLVIPGGESTAMVKLINKYDFKNALDKFHNRKKPVFGTCAGMILLSKSAEGSDFTLGYIDIEVKRNAYGRQIDSFEQLVELKNAFLPGSNFFKAVFIRAPQIKKIGNNVEILARFNNYPVMVREDNVIACSFHPELTDDMRIHNYFIDMVKNSVNMIQSVCK